MRILIIVSRLVAIILFAISLSGCDFFRTLAGRPTSADIEEMKAQIELERIVSRQADSLQADSLQRDSLQRDSLQRKQLQVERMQLYRDSLGTAGVLVVPSRRISNISPSQLTRGYYIMIGTFSSVENAERLAARVSDAGYSVEKLPYTNGKYAVAVCPSDDPEEIYQSLKKVRNEEFSPSDIWILVKE